LQIRVEVEPDQADGVRSSAADAVIRHLHMDRQRLAGRVVGIRVSHRRAEDACRQVDRLVVDVVAVPVDLHRMGLTRIRIAEADRQITWSAFLEATGRRRHHEIARGLINRLDHQLADPGFIAPTEAHAFIAPGQADVIDVQSNREDAAMSGVDVC
jgi:hypothetical protein